MKVVDIAPKQEDNKTLIETLAELTASLIVDGDGEEEGDVILITVNKGHGQVAVRHTLGLVDTVGTLEIVKMMIVQGEMD